MSTILVTAQNEFNWLLFFAYFNHKHAKDMQVSVVIISSTSKLKPY